MFTAIRGHKVLSTPKWWDAFAFNRLKMIDFKIYN